MTLIAVTVYVPSVAPSWAKAIWSPTARSDTAIVAPPLVIVVVLVTEMVRVQSSPVFRDRWDPLIAVIVMSRAPNRPKPPRPKPPGPPKPPKPCRSLSGLLVPGAALEPGGADGAGFAARPRAVE